MSGCKLYLLDLSFFLLFEIENNTVQIRQNAHVPISFSHNQRTNEKVIEIIESFGLKLKIYDVKVQSIVREHLTFYFNRIQLFIWVFKHIIYSHPYSKIGSYSRQ